MNRLSYTLRSLDATAGAEHATEKVRSGRYDSIDENTYEPRVMAISYKPTRR